MRDYEMTPFTQVHPFKAATGKDPLIGSIVIPTVRNEFHANPLIPITEFPEIRLSSGALMQQPQQMTINFSKKGIATATINGLDDCGHLTTQHMVVSGFAVKDTTPMRTPAAQSAELGRSYKPTGLDPSHAVPFLDLLSVDRAAIEGRRATYLLVYHKHPLSRWPVLQWFAHRAAVLEAAKILRPGDTKDNPPYIPPESRFVTAAIKHWARRIYLQLKSRLGG